MRGWVVMAALLLGLGGARPTLAMDAVDCENGTAAACRRLADQGSAFFQYDLGTLYATGRGVPQSYVDAARWYRKAAEQGLSVAQNALGEMYEYGRGLPHDYVEAINWYSLAAAQGYFAAINNRDRLTARIGPRNPQVAAVPPPAPAAPIPPAKPKRLAKVVVPPATPVPAVTMPPSKEEPLERVVGTGFIVTNNGDTLTAAHVVEKCSRPHLRSAGNSFAARVIARDKQNDLALLRAEFHPAEVAHLRLLVRQGEDVAVYGFPLAGLLASGGNITTGTVAALAGIGDDSRYVQISAPVQPGNSGGPLLDQAGNVIGMVVSKLDALKVASLIEDIPQNVNFAIKASVAGGFLDANNVAYESGQASAKLALADIAERAKTFTVGIECGK